MGTNTVAPSGSPPLTTIEINTISTTTTLATAVIPHYINIYRLSLTLSTTTTLEFTGGANFRRYDFNSGGSIVLDYSGRSWYTAIPGSALIMTQTSTAQISGEIDYAYVDTP